MIGSTGFAAMNVTSESMRQFAAGCLQWAAAFTEPNPRHSILREARFGRRSPTQLTTTLRMGALKRFPIYDLNSTKRALYDSYAPLLRPQRLLEKIACNFVAGRVALLRNISARERAVSDTQISFSVIHGWLALEADHGWGNAGLDQES